GGSGPVAGPGRCRGRPPQGRRRGRGDPAEGPGRAAGGRGAKQGGGGLHHAPVADAAGGADGAARAGPERQRAGLPGVPRAEGERGRQGRLSGNPTRPLFSCATGSIMPGNVLLANDGTRMNADGADQRGSEGEKDSSVLIRADPPDPRSSASHSFLPKITDF